MEIQKALDSKWVTEKKRKGSSPMPISPADSKKMLLPALVDSPRPRQEHEVESEEEGSLSSYERNRRQKTKKKKLFVEKNNVSHPPEQEENTKSGDHEELMVKKPSHDKSPKQSASAEATKPFQRAWSEEDETILLRAMIEYMKVNNVGMSNVDLKDMVDRIRISCNFHFEPRIWQVREKIRKLGRKYCKIYKNGGFSNLIPHEKKIYELSMKVWGDLVNKVPSEATGKYELLDANHKLSMPVPQKSKVDRQIKQFEIRQQQLYKKRLELLIDEAQLQLEMLRSDQVSTKIKVVHGGLHAADASFTF